MMEQKALALEIWKSGVAAVDGYGSVMAALPDVPRPDKVLAVGKAAAAMMKAAQDHFDAPPGLVITKDGHAEGLPSHIKVIEAAHPVPDARSLQAGRALSEAVETMAPGSHLLLLVSGGASSLAEDLVPGATLNDLARLNTRLLSGGLDIGAMNARRRELSRIKGGGLISRFPGARVTVLAISDVPGDDIAVIGSGIGAPPENPGFAVHTAIVASNALARRAAVEVAQNQGLAVLSNEEALHDDYLSVAAQLGERLRQMNPGAMIFGGEPTVQLPESPGCGGRNQALALALAREISGCPGFTVVVGGTDGTDGPTDAAGAVVTGNTWTDEATDALAKADSGRFLRDAGALLITGPTGTNVMDLVVAIRI